MIERCLTFQFWDLILRLKRLILVFVKANREANFQLYICEGLRSFDTMIFCPRSCQLLTLASRSYKT